MRMDKPTVFNYRDHVELKEEYAKLKHELVKLRAENANLQIRCRILEEDMKHQKGPGCISRAALFNKLSYIKAPPEANEYKAEVYALIQSM